MKLRHIVRWLARRNVVVVSVLLIAIAAVFVWLIVSGFSSDAVIISIGIAALSALFSAISSFAGLLEAVETQRQRENQERPYVIAFFDGASSGAVYFVVENCGNSPALNITLKFEPPPIDYAGRRLDEISLFSKSIDFLPAGKSFRQIVDVGHRLLADDRPAKFRVSVSYQSIQGDKYDHSVQHDLDYLRQATLPEKSVGDNLAVIAEQLKKLVKSLENVQGKIGTKTFLVESPDHYQSRVRRIAQQYQEIPRWKTLARSFLEWCLSRL